MRKLRNIMIPLFLLQLASARYYGQDDFSETFSLLKISENTSPGSEIFNLATVLPEAPQVASARIFSEFAENFKIQNGALFLSKRLDREKICNSADFRCEFIVKLLVEPFESKKSEKLVILQISLADENDSLPEFEFDFGSKTMDLCSESVRNGIYAAPFVADDADRVSILRYGLKNTASFTLEEKEEVDSFGNSRDQLTLKLVGESKAPEEMVVQVSDGLHQVEKTAIVNVVDNCKENAKFSQQIYEATLPENVKNFATGIILSLDTMIATEAIEFRLGSEVAREHLAINHETGEIHLIKSLDYEITQRIRSVVELVDLYTNAIIDFTIIDISVKDVNDNVPVITATVIPPASVNNDKVILREDFPTSVALAYFSASDADLASAGEVTLDLLMGKDYFELREGFLVLRTPLDRESQNLIDVSVSACDNGRPKKCAQSVLTFVVSDVNDNSPFFTMCPEEVLVSESQPPNKLLTVVRAFDNDNLPGLSSPNGVVSYSTSSSVVAVSSTGQVFLNQKLDRERISSYTISIEAFDQGVPVQNSARCTFNLIVGDENDNAPLFDEATEFVKVIPNTLGKNEIVYDFNVVDKDDGKNAMFFLELEDDFDLFYINSANELRLSRNFTSTDPSRVNLIVRARDSGDLTSEISFAVEILPPEALMRSSTQELAIASICGLMAVIFVLCLVIFCLKQRRQQTYKFRNAEDKEESNIHASKQTLSNWTVEIKNDAALVKTNLIVDPSEDGSGLYKTRSQDHGSDFIPDSGRGESEKDSVSSTMGPNCSKDCSVIGHSDACWMPSSRNEEIMSSSSIVGYSREHLSKLSQQYLTNQNRLANLSPICDQESQRSSGYLSSLDARNVHYC
ncbi:Oidioi.mRNA.OKI2018_I69.chr1.g1322.t1.cds [Oikopleura dioica]|uniref:Oidioi.mRNA.OKI2018_I69.chr1.g1322.t1.cds n=1 Tax=Oikopleura dioica TaxID=34765 RepID=A0ABN7SMI9_OIKDI|nr:Oidioi.mRNA.OKI2018_I69.chr1.g1322.t1.cds [Oikopleura dioica]